MAATRKARVPMAEQIRLINECRQSGMTDADWCRENGIAVSTFYNWVSRCRKTAADQIPAPNYGHCEIPRSKQDVVPIDIVSDRLLEQHVASQMRQTNLDTSPPKDPTTSSAGGMGKPPGARPLHFRLKAVWQTVVSLLVGRLKAALF